MNGTATYLYCVVHAARKPLANRAPRGLPGSSRPALAALSRSLWLVTASVPLETYGPDSLESLLRDVQWVTDLALAHESVVEHFARQARATVIPMKLLTMFSSDTRAIEDMRSRRRDLESVAKRIAGCEEWGVRILRRPPVSSSAQPRKTDRTSGTTFLAAKKAARDAARESASAAADAAERAFTVLAKLARDTRRRDDIPEGATAPPLLDAAFLVPTGSRTRFKAAVKKLAGTSSEVGIDLTLTGPWPSYNFVHTGSES